MDEHWGSHVMTPDRRLSEVRRSADSTGDSAAYLKALAPDSATSVSYVQFDRQCLI